MAVTQKTGRIAVSMGAADTFTLGDASGHSVSRFRLHVTECTGTTTVKGVITGDTVSTPTAVAVVTTVGSTTTGSTIAATGFYDLDATGFSLSLLSGTSMTFSYVPVEG